MTNEEMDIKAKELNCKSLLVGYSTGYFFCNEKGSLPLDDKLEFCKKCKEEKELKIISESKRNANFWLRIANCMGKYRK